MAVVNGSLSTGREGEGEGEGERERERKAPRRLVLFFSNPDSDLTLSAGTGLRRL
jgi:hypothetical protein